MFRQLIVLIAAWSFAGAIASADPVQTFSSENSFIAALNATNQVIGGENWDNVPFDDGYQIQNGSKINGISYDSRLSVHIQDNVTTDAYGARSPNNSLAVALGSAARPFTRFDAITFRFDQAISSFGLSFGTGEGPDAGTYGFRTNNGYEATSGYDSNGNWTGQFAGLIGPEAFNEVTIFVDQPLQWENLSFVLDNMIIGREQSGAISLAVNSQGGAINSGSSLSFLLFGTAPAGGQPGGTFPAVEWMVPEEFSPFQNGLAAGDSAVVLGTIEAQFGSPHIYTGDEEGVDPDVQQALVAAWADIQLGLEGTFADYLVERGYFQFREEVQFGDPGSVVEGISASDYLDFVERFNPNVLPDGAALDPTFRDRLNQIYFNEVNQEQFTQSGLEEIIYPHDDFASLPTLVRLGFGADGQISASLTSASPVPEPGTLVTLGLAIAAGAVVYRRRRRDAA